MSQRHSLSHLTATGGQDSFLAVIDRLEEERDPTGQLTHEITAGRRKFIARETPEHPRFEALVESLRSKLDLPRPAGVIQALRNAELRTAFVAEVGALTAAEVAQLAGSRAKNSSALAGRWRTERRIFAVPWGGDLLYPAFQFAHGEPRPTIARVLQAFGQRPSGWEVALWFATPSPYLPHNARPLEWLDDPDALVAAARAERELPEF
jgi:hypothetical protein